MNLNRIFSTQEIKNEAIEHFRSLMDNTDWIFLVEKLIQADISDLTEKLLDPNHEWKEGEEREAKRMRAYWIILSQLPEELIKALTENQSDIFTESDPYFKNMKEIKANSIKKK